MDVKRAQAAADWIEDRDSRNAYPGLEHREEEKTNKEDPI